MNDNIINTLVTDDDHRSKIESAQFVYVVAMSGGTKFRKKEQKNAFLFVGVVVNNN